MKLYDQNLSVLILAGGRGTRMNGADKGLIKVHGKFIIEYLINMSKKFSSDVFINANRNISVYKTLKCNVIKDVLKDYQGPLAGIYSGLLQIQTDYLITLPCDGPLISDEYFVKMLESPMTDKIKCAYCNDRLQPVYALIPKKLIGSLKKFLDSGERKIDQWYSKCGLEIVDFSDKEEIFINVNSEEELLQYENEIRKRLLG